MYERNALADLMRNRYRKHSIYGGFVGDFEHSFNIQTSIEIDKLRYRNTFQNNTLYAFNIRKMHAYCLTTSQLDIYSPHIIRLKSLSMPPHSLTHWDHARLRFNSALCCRMYQLDHKRTNTRIILYIAAAEHGLICSLATTHTHTQ